MIYFEFNRTGGKEKYTQITEEVFRQAVKQEGRYFIRYMKEGKHEEDYVIESTKQEFMRFWKGKNHSEYVQKNADNRKVIPLSLDTDEIEGYDSTSAARNIFHNGDNSTIDEQVLAEMYTAEKYELLYQAIEQLDAEEQYIINQIFFAHRTQTELAKEFHIEQQAVSKKYRSALKKLKTYLEGKV